MLYVSNYEIICQRIQFQKVNTKKPQKALMLNEVLIYFK